MVFNHVATNLLSEKWQHNPAKQIEILALRQRELNAELRGAGLFPDETAAAHRKRDNCRPFGVESNGAFMCENAAISLWCWRRQTEKFCERLLQAARVPGATKLALTTVDYYQRARSAWVTDAVARLGSRALCFFERPYLDHNGLIVHNDRSVSSLGASVIQWFDVVGNENKDLPPAFAMRRLTATAFEGPGDLRTDFVGLYPGAFSTASLPLPSDDAAILAAISKSLDEVPAFFGLVSGRKNPRYTGLFAPVLRKVRDPSHLGVRTSYSRGVFDRRVRTKYSEGRQADDDET